LSLHKLDTTTWWSNTRTFIQCGYPGHHAGTRNYVNETYSGIIKYGKVGDFHLTIPSKTGFDDYTLEVLTLIPNTPSIIGLAGFYNSGDPRHIVIVTD